MKEVVLLNRSFTANGWQDSRVSGRVKRPMDSAATDAFDARSPIATSAPCGIEAGRTRRLVPASSRLRNAPKTMMPSVRQVLRHTRHSAWFCTSTKFREGIAAGGAVYLEQRAVTRPNHRPRILRGRHREHKRAELERFASGRSGDADVRHGVAVRTRADLVDLRLRIVRDRELLPFGKQSFGLRRATRSFGRGGAKLDGAITE